MKRKSRPVRQKLVHATPARRSFAGLEPNIVRTCVSIADNFHNNPNLKV